MICFLMDLRLPLPAREPAYITNRLLPRRASVEGHAGAISDASAAKLKNSRSGEDSLCLRSNHR
jgi:hypothetical protein